MTNTVSNRFGNRVVLVTGAAGGIGRAVAERFAREGAQVTVNDLSEDAVRTVVDSITAAGGRALAVPADVSDAVQVDAMFTLVEAAFGYVDVLYNNAGLIDTTRHFLEGDERWWDHPDKPEKRVLVFAPGRLDDDAAPQGRHHQHLVWRRDPRPPWECCL